jgi:hypothetical protein
MRRILLGLTLLLPGCAYVGNPFAGFGGFIGDTHTFQRGSNSPPGDSTNMLRARGEVAPSEPLLPEQGNIWPGPPPPEPTLSDLERQQGLENPTAPSPGQEFPRLPPPRGSSTPPAPEQPPGAPMSSLPPFTPPPAQPAAPIKPTPPVAVQTEHGLATITTDANGIQSYRLPDGSSGHVVNNGNGTLTMIGNDGRVFSAPAPR